MELKHLDVLSRQQSHFRVSYLRPRYYRDTASFEKATIQAGKFNVLRQLDSDRSRESSMNDAGAVATLMRAKASIWTRKKDGDRCAVGSFGFLSYSTNDRNANCMKPSCLWILLSLPTKKDIQSGVDTARSRSGHLTVPTTPTLNLRGLHCMMTWYTGRHGSRTTISRT